MKWPEEIFGPVQETKEKVEKIFKEKKRKLGVEADLELEFLERTPTEENVFGEAFPFEKPPRVKLEIFAPYATDKEIVEGVCDELIHVKHPEIEQYVKGTLEETEKFKRKMRECLNPKGNIMAEIIKCDCIRKDAKDALDNALKSRAMDLDETVSMLRALRMGEWDESLREALSKNIKWFEDRAKLDREMRNLIKKVPECK